MNKLLPVFALALAACDLPAPPPASSGSPAASGAPASTGAAAAEAPAPAGGNVAPADALDDSGKPQASCDDTKKTGYCTEYFDLGMTEEVTKNNCEGMGATGTFQKGKPCPTENRVAVCRTDTMRTMYFKNFAFAPGNTLVEVGKLCTTGLEGKFAEVPKK